MGRNRNGLLEADGKGELKHQRCDNGGFKLFLDDAGDSLN